MLTRRLLRIKVIQLLYAFYSKGDDSISSVEKELFYSIDKTYDLYHYIFFLIVEIKIYVQERIRLAKEKHIPTYEDLNPKIRFVNNRVIGQIANNNQLNEYLANRALTWSNYPELIKNLYNNLQTSEYYKKYIEIPETFYESDRQFIIDILTYELVKCDLLFQILEEQCIYWNDDLEFVISMIIKTIGKFKESDSGEIHLMNLYKNDEDKEFVRKLFRSTISKEKETRGLIETFTQNWDIERIAFMDILMMQTAITEIMDFPLIPIKVSFDEYIEISKLYSTNKSGIFINGVLDKIINTLKKENKIIKTGTGLIEESKRN